MDCYFSKISVFGIYKQETDRDNIRYIMDLPNWSYDGSLERNAHRYMSLLYQNLKKTKLLKNASGPLSSGHRPRNRQKP